MGKVIIWEARRLCIAEQAILLSTRRTMNDEDTEAHSLKTPQDLRECQCQCHRKRLFPRERSLTPHSLKTVLFHV